MKVVKKRNQTESTRNHFNFNFNYSSSRQDILTACGFKLHGIAVSLASTLTSLIWCLLESFSIFPLVFVVNIRNFS